MKEYVHSRQFTESDRNEVLLSPLKDHCILGSKRHKFLKHQQEKSNLLERDYGCTRLGLFVL